MYKTFTISWPVGLVLKWPRSHALKVIIMMKLSMLFLLVGMMHVSASSLAQHVTLHKKNVGLKEIFDEINQQTGLDFVWSAKAIDSKVKASISVHNEAIETVLAKVLKDLPLTFELVGQTVILTRAPSAGNERPSVTDPDKLVFSYAEVRGRVVDTLGNPLEGASVRVLNVAGKRTSLQTVTNRDGMFVLENVPENAYLEISFMGYVTKKIRSASDVGRIVLQVIRNTVEEVEINAGYYKVRDRERTGSISRVSAAEIEAQPVLNPLAALIGRMPGVHITQSAGIPGSGFTVEIRGRNTISTLGNPLYIVDGVPFSSEGLGSSQVGPTILGISQAVSGVSTFGLSPLTGINPSDIESIEVLKDADATAIYGSRGANGVVLITTKRPKTERTVFNLRYSKGLGKVPMNYQLMDTETYLEMRREAYANDGVTTYPASAYDINGTWDPNRYTDWQQTLVGGTASQDNFQASVGGGNENTQFLLGGGYMKETSVFPGDYFNNKISGRSVVTHRSDNGRFDLSLTLGYTVDKNDFPGSDLNYYAVRLVPNAPPLYQQDGSLNWENGTWTNPLSYTEQNYLSKYDNLMANTVLGYRLWKGLSLKTSIGFNNVKMNESRTVPNTQYNPAYGIGPDNSSINISSTSRQCWILEPQLLYDVKLDDSWGINALVGMTFQENSSSMLAQSASGFTSNSLIYDVKAAARNTIFDNSDIEYRYGALFGRLNLSWKSRYILNLTGRRDGSSRFGPGRQFANFGAAGASWLFSEERWIKEQFSILSFGKLRGSFGITGSDNIGDYKFLDTYATTANSYQNIKGLQPSGLFNPNFAWESNQKREVALELGFLSNRIQLNTGYYYNLSSNQLVGIPLSGVTGFKSIQANLDATVLNKGWEFELSTTNLHAPGFSWTSSINLTIPHNELLSFPGLESSTYATRYIIGQPLNIVKVMDFLGVDPQTGLSQFRDLNGDGILNTIDRQSIGRVYQQYYGGFNNSVVIGKLSVDVFLQFVKQTGRNYLTSIAIPGGASNQPVELMDRWRQPGDQSQIQKFSVSNVSYNAFSNLYYSNAAYSDASFIRLKNVMASYELEGQYMGEIKGRLFLQGQNLLTFTRYRGIDPETNSTANSATPPLRMITFGFDFNF